MVKVLLVEDELLLARIIKDSLESRGYEVVHAADGRQGLELFATQQPDILVLDVMMPQMDGFTLAAEIRRYNTAVPIIFLTARSQVEDVVKGFELGGNDYLRKPFSMEELIVRIKALLQRPAPGDAPPAENGIFQIGAYTFDPVKQVLAHPQEQIVLSHRESELLRHLCMHRNAVLERGVALRELWGDDSIFNARSMDVYITKIRRHLQHDSTVQIINVRGIGYKLIC
ncbi:MAG: response regulator transcription factor [Saprospiraceae bacterium]|nr:response regulator transcription factor [Saprospiraceae bacterium]